MAAAKLDIVVEQGATFLRTVTIKDSAGVEIDITGWTLRGQIRESQSAAAALATFTCALLNQTTDTGKATFQLSAATTAAMQQASYAKPTLKSSFYLYDLEVEKPGGEVIRLLQGAVTFVPEITK